jgi:hypothetical protein
MWIICIHISDNPESDILGANLFDRYLQDPTNARCKFDDVNMSIFEDNTDSEHQTVNNVSRCLSILVETGVYSAQCRMNGIVAPVSMFYEHLDTGLHMALRQPTFVESDLYSAVQMVFKRERYHPIVAPVAVVPD